MTLRSRSVVALVVLACIAAACANDGGTSSGGTGGATVSAPSSAGGSSDDGTGGRYGSGGGYGSGSESDSGSGGGPVALTLTQSNYRFSPAKPSVTSGDTIKIENSTSSTQHTFTVTGQGIDIVVDPGSSQTVGIDLPPGSYPFECRFHASSGMTGTLVVG